MNKAFFFMIKNMLKGYRIEHHKLGNDSDEAVYKFVTNARAQGLEIRRFTMQQSEHDPKFAMLIAVSPSANLDKEVEFFLST